MNYIELLKESAKDRNSIVCMGLDPVVEAMPDHLAGQGIDGALGFFEAIFNEMIEHGVFPGAFKPNEGFYVSENAMRTSDPSLLTEPFQGSEVLYHLLDLIETKFPGIPIILDAKRGDIAKSSKNYAVEAFDKYGATATTISPFMGSDSVGRFIDYCTPEHGKGVYVLNRTSNPGAHDFQDLTVVLDDVQMPLYRAVSHRIMEWAKGRPGVGAVVGATSPAELEATAALFAGADIPMLIPGVGGQGGSAEEVMARLNSAGYDPTLARINSSSGITHPWAKRQEPAPSNFAEVCVGELRKLNEQINYRHAA